VADRQQQKIPAIPANPLSPSEAWQVAKSQFKKMTDAEKVQTLKDAGILTPSGKLAKPYRDPAPIKAKRK
jgi:hypothetical protein